jgi:chromosome segregation ATPase
MLKDRRQSRDRLQEQLVVLQERLASANDKLANEAKSHDDLRKQLAALESCLQDHRREAEGFNQALKAMQSQHERNREKAQQAETLLKDNDQAAQTIARLQKQLEDVETRLTQSTSPRASSQ